MRTFVLTLSVAALAVSFAAPSSATAQRNARRFSRKASAPSTPGAQSASARPCSSDCDDYSLAIVSALLPQDAPGANSDMVTIVIENKGTVTAPVSLISVAPRNHLTLARRSAIPALAPGQRTTVELPVETGPDGTQCLSITLTTAPATDPATARFLASAIPDLTGGSKYPSSGGSRSLGELLPFGDY